jgi:DNA-binding NarL/FixJ family response regulator
MEIEGATDAPAKRVRLLLIDDHLIVREGLVALLSLEPEIEVVGSAATIAEGIELYRSARPDLVISDLNLPGCSGGAAVRALCQACPEARVLVLTVHDSLEFIRAAFKAGAVGYVRKDALRQEMMYAIQRAAAGGRSTCLAVRDIVVKDWLEHGSIKEPIARIELGGEDRHVLRLIALGTPTWRIAEELGRGVKAVEKYRVMLMRRLGLKSTAAATRFALEMRLLTRQEVDQLLTAEQSTAR